MRQREDKEFAEILNRIREGNHTEADIEVLKERILNISPQHPDYPISLTHLFSTNMAVDQHNHDVFHDIKAIQIQIDTDISQHTPYQGFSVTGYIMNR